MDNLCFLTQNSQTRSNFAIWNPKIPEFVFDYGFFTTSSLYWEKHSLSEKLLAVKLSEKKAKKVISTSQRIGSCVFNCGLGTHFWKYRQRIRRRVERKKSQQAFVCLWHCPHTPPLVIHRLDLSTISSETQRVLCCATFLQFQAKSWGQNFCRTMHDLSNIW